MFNVQRSMFDVAALPWERRRLAGSLFEIEISLPPVNLITHETIASFRAVLDLRRSLCFHGLPKTRNTGCAGGHDRFDRFGNKCLGTHRGTTEIAHRQTVRRRRADGRRDVRQSPPDTDRHDVPQEHGHE